MNQFLFRLAQGLDVSNLPNSQGGITTEQAIPIIRDVIFGVFGAVAVLIITIAGFQYVMSQGDSQKTAKAKDTILYAVIGLVITILSYGIVTFVIERI